MQFWHKDVIDTPPDINGVLAKQDENLRGENPDTELLRLPSPPECKYPCAIRLAKRPHYQAWEYTGIVEFKDFLFFVVLFTLPNVAKRNIRKLHEILTWVRPGHFKDKRSDKSKPGDAILDLG
jgi:hypothetical protein